MDEASRDLVARELVHKVGAHAPILPILKGHVSKKRQHARKIGASQLTLRSNSRDLKSRLTSFHIEPTGSNAALSLSSMSSLEIHSRLVLVVLHDKKAPGLQATWTQAVKIPGLQATELVRLPGRVA